MGGVVELPGAWSTELELSSRSGTAGRNCRVEVHAVDWGVARSATCLPLKAKKEGKGVRKGTRREGWTEMIDENRSSRRREVSHEASEAKAQPHG